MTNQEIKFYLFKILNRDMTLLKFGSTWSYPRNKIYYFVDHLPELTEQTLNNFLISYKSLKDLIWQKVNSGEVDRFNTEQNPGFVNGNVVNVIKIMANSTLNAAVNNTFSIIGVSSIALSGEPTDNGTGLNITLSNGVTMNAISALISSSVYFVTEVGQEYYYSLKSFPYYSLENVTLQNLSDIPAYTGRGQVYGVFGTGAKDNELTIKGAGETAGVKDLIYNNSESYKPSNYSKIDTLIIDPSIDHCLSGTAIWGGEVSTISKSFQIKKIVIKRPADQPLLLASGWIPDAKSGANPKPVFDIYSDHPAVSSYAYGSNITVNIHPLSEWGG